MGGHHLSRSLAAAGGASAEVGENFIASLYLAAGKSERQVYVNLRGTGVGTYRKFDVLTNRIAHEVKTGHHLLTPDIRSQIIKDAYLRSVGRVDDVHWHIVPSGKWHSVGGSNELFDMLDEYNIRYTIHLPID